MLKALYWLLIFIHSEIFIVKAENWHQVRGITTLFNFWVIFTIFYSVNSNNSATFTLDFSSLFFPLYFLIKIFFKLEVVCVICDCLTTSYNSLVSNKIDVHFLCVLIWSKVLFSHFKNIILVFLIFCPPNFHLIVAKCT